MIKIKQEHLDILINNTIISGNVPQNAIDENIESFKVFEVNIYG